MLHIGDKVLIISGGFSGLKGTIVKPVSKLPLSGGWYSVFIEEENERMQYHESELEKQG